VVSPLTFASGAFVWKSLSQQLRVLAVRRDFEKRIPRDCHVSINPFPIVQLDDCLTGDEFALWVDDLPLSSLRIYRCPELIASHNLLSWPGGTNTVHRHAYSRTVDRSGDRSCRCAAVDWQAARRADVQRLPLRPTSPNCSLSVRCLWKNEFRRFTPLRESHCRVF
jgi:hypothetical protein